MLRSDKLGMAMLVLLPALGLAQAEEHKLTLDATDGTLGQLVEMMTRATGVTVLATEADAKVTIKLTNVELEAAVKAVADAIEGSWMRTYVIEPKEGAEPDGTTAETLQKLQFAWRDWMIRRSDEELDAYRERALEAMRDQPPTPPEETAGGGVMFDPVTILNGAFHVEQISLKPDDVTVQQALDQFTLQSGYITLLSPAVQGNVSLDVTDEKLDKVLDAIGEPANAHWRPLYIISRPRELSPDEIEQRFSQMLEQGAQQFWQLPPDQRQQIVQRVSDRLANLPPEALGAIQGSSLAPRILGRVMRFVLTLTPDQRREVAPIMQGLGRLMGQ